MTFFNDIIILHRYGVAFISVVVAAMCVSDCSHSLEVLIDLHSLNGGSSQRWCSTSSSTYHPHPFFPVSLVQTLYYYANQNDTWHTKLTVRGNRSGFRCHYHDIEFMTRSLLLLSWMSSIKLLSRTRVSCISSKFWEVLTWFISVYTYSITDWGNPGKFQFLVW